MILVGSIVAVGPILLSSVVVPSSGSIYYPQEAQVFLRDGFESGDFGAWNGTFTTVGDYATVASTSAYEGVCHGCFQTDDIVSGMKYAYSYVELSPTVSEVYARSYFYFVDGLPLDDNGDRFGLVGFEVGGKLQSTFRVLRSGSVDKFSVVGLNGPITIQESTNAVYPAEGRWYCIEFYIKVHGTMGEYRAWINGVERITITNIDTAHYGADVSRVRLGLTYTANVQHNVEVNCDSTVIGTRYVGQLRYSFGVIGLFEENPAVQNFYWLFGNQSISYRAILPSDVTDFADVDRFDGLVVWTNQGGYNSRAIRQFAQTRVVISHVRDFSNILYPSLSQSTQVVNTNTVTYTVDWGNFRNSDLVEMRNETGNTNQLTTVLTSGLSGFTNITTIARYDPNRIAFFHMNGMHSKSGFYVLDLDATTPETEWAGIWHVFPAIKIVKDFPTGKYARWFANGVEHWTYDEVMARLGRWVANAPRGMNASLIRIGKSVLGRDINATRFGNGSRYIVVDANIHGCEKHPTPALLRLLEVIQENFEANSYWKHRLSEVSLIVIPILNPDGHVAGTRENANGVDLNRQFPPQTTTEPEAWALRWVWGNYSTLLYINLHTGRHWYPSNYYYAPYLPTDPVDIKEFSRQNCYWTKDDFEALHHWGYYTEEGRNINIGTVNSIGQGGLSGTAHTGASYLHNISSYLVESFVWSSSYNGHKARQMLWAMDFYITTVLGMIGQLDRLRNENFLAVTQGNIKSFVWTGQLRLEIDTSNLSSSATVVAKIDVGHRAKPSVVLIDGKQENEGDGWTYSSGIVTVEGAKNTVELGW